MKSLSLFGLLTSFFSLALNVSGTEVSSHEDKTNQIFRSQCSQKLDSMGILHLDNHELICSRATQWTPQVLDYAYRIGVREPYHFAALAGEATELTTTCINFVRSELRAFRLFTDYARLCRNINLHELHTLYQVVDLRLFYGQSALKIAIKYSRTSFLSYARFFRRVYNMNYCETVQLPLEICAERN